MQTGPTSQYWGDASTLKNCGSQGFGGFDFAQTRDDSIERMTFWKEANKVSPTSQSTQN
jgi:hypothetical protein